MQCRGGSIAAIVAQLALARARVGTSTTSREFALRAPRQNNVQYMRARARRRAVVQMRLLANAVYAHTSAFDSFLIKSSARAG